MLLYYVVLLKTSRLHVTSNLGLTQELFFLCLYTSPGAVDFWLSTMRWTSFRLRRLSQTIFLSEEVLSASQSVI